MAQYEWIVTYTSEEVVKHYSDFSDAAKAKRQIHGYFPKKTIKEIRRPTAEKQAIAFGEAEEVFADFVKHLESAN